MKNRLWIISGLYPIEKTEYLPTRIAENLARSYSVSVLCGHADDSSLDKKDNRFHIHSNVDIFRCKGTNLNNSRAVAKFVNYVSNSFSMFLSALIRIKRKDLVVVVTNPPLLIYTIGLACWLRGAKCVLLIYDVYPDALVATGLIQETSILNRVLSWFTQTLYRHVAAIIVIGRDMEKLVLRKIPGRSTRVDLITNCANTNYINPLPRNQNALLIRLGLIDKFVIQYSGNIGLTHGIESLFLVAHKLVCDSAYHFLFIGSGAKKEWLEKQIKLNGLKNITVLPKQPHEDLCETLNGCDVSIISLSPGMAGISVPSRLYNVMAAGKPIIAVTDGDSELASVVNEEMIGWVVPPNDEEQVVATIRVAKSNTDLLHKMGIRARNAAERKYSFEKIMNSYRGLIDDLEKQTNR